MFIMLLILWEFSSYGSFKYGDYVFDSYFLPS